MSDALAARLDALERRHRRLRRACLVLALLLAVLAAGDGYALLRLGWHPGVATRNVQLFKQAPFTPSQAMESLLGRHVSIEPEFWPMGSLGMNYRGDGAGLHLWNRQHRAAGLSISPRGAFLSLTDSTRAVYLGPGLYDDDQLLLELITKDGQQGLRLGLDALQRPVFDVIRDGMTVSLLDAPAASVVHATAE
ncbi:MAG: hypothetical protein R3247_12685 [Rhodothermales bacterium]|nr:hypothetical protein [Rhodothermales bacterium]